MSPNSNFSSYNKYLITDAFVIKNWLTFLLAKWLSFLLTKARISWQLFQKWRLCYLKQCRRECDQAIYCRQKNWLFSDTPRGAKASAAIYSIVETAKANGLDVFKYFELLLTVLPSMAFLTNPDIIEELLPWNESTQKICRLP